MIVRNILLVIAVSFFTVACNKAPLKVKNSAALVKIGNKVLYRSDLEENIPAGLSKEDSIIASEHFIRSWVNDILLYNIAVKNLSDKGKIDRMVEDYRRSLFIYQYEERLVNERLTKEIDEQALYDYYNQNKDKLQVERPLIQGIFLKVPVSAPQLKEMRLWYKSTTSDARENLEKNSAGNAVIYDYFVDTWTDFNSVMDKFPKDLLNRADFAVRKKTLEKQDDDYFYLLNITDCLLPGDNAPYENAKETVKEILINQRKIEFLKKTQDELYQRALDKDEIQFYNE